MQKKIIVIVLVGFGFVFMFSNQKKDGDLIISVAACPTFHYMLEKLEKREDINIIKTESTAESLFLMNQGIADITISGRALKEEEPKLFFEKLGQGYDFIFKEEIILFEHEMNSIDFYTDLPLDEIIRDFKYISEENLIKVENPYEYLNKGIVITFLNEFLVGEPVHILKIDESRVQFSRAPRIYYSEKVSSEKIADIAGVLK